MPPFAPAPDAAPGVAVPPPPGGPSSFPSALSAPLPSTSAPWRTGSPNSPPSWTPRPIASSAWWPSSTGSGDGCREASGAAPSGSPGEPGWRPGAARERVRVARALEELPRISAALERGELSYSKARALTRVAHVESEERLLAVALHATAAQTERLVAGWARLDREAATAATAPMNGASAREAEALRHAARHLHLRPDPVDGSWILKGRLDPEVGMLLQKALELAGEALFRAESEAEPGAEPGRERTPAAARRADAVGLLAETALRAGVEASAPDAAAGTRTRTTGRADRFQVILHVSAETSGAGGRVTPERAALRPDALLPPATRDRLACDASRVVVREAPDGTPLDVGRRSRIVPPASGERWIFGTAGVAFRDAETASATPTTSSRGRTAGPPTSRTSSSFAAATTASSTRGVSAWSAWPVAPRAMPGHRVPPAGRHGLPGGPLLPGGPPKQLDRGPGHGRGRGRPGPCLGRPPPGSITPGSWAPTPIPPRGCAATRRPP
jgi:hypothetical protein